MRQIFPAGSARTTLLGSTKLSVPLSQALTGAISDVTGATWSFIYGGRPVIHVVRMPWLKFGTGSSTLNWFITDATGSGPTNAKVFFEEPHVTAPATTQFFTHALQTDPQTTATDGTAMVSGQSYTLKLQVASPGASATLTSTWVGATAFYASMSTYEVG